MRSRAVMDCYYPRLCQWAHGLTRGDQEMAEDIVHDLYLYVALSNPEFAQVQNLDGYLYQSLRHLYLSTLARASREATQSVSMAEYDSLELALWSRPTHNPQQEQNDLRRICAYALWRRNQIKGACYFILRFFHGYRLREISDLAVIPGGVVRSKLCEFRSELRDTLSDTAPQGGKAQYDEPELPWMAVNWQTLMQDLRKMILDSCHGECLSEEELEQYYRSSYARPLPIEKLAHVTCCESCLARIDSIFRRPTLKDRDPDDAGEGAWSGSSRKQKDGLKALHRRLERHCEDLYHHYPETLSIAINGKIVVVRDIKATSNMLSMRFDDPRPSNFVEVFSEQGLRLGMLAIHALPPEGEEKLQIMVELSEGRSLTLTLTLDGQGLLAEALYRDPLMAEVQRADKGEEECAVLLPMLVAQGASARQTASVRRWLRQLAEWLRSVTNPPRTPVIAAVLVLLIFCAANLLLRNPQPAMEASVLLQRAEQAQTITPKQASGAVIVQRVGIRSAHGELQRTIYRDAEGKRQARQQTLDASQQSLKGRLAMAGIDWDQPLAAVSYERWIKSQARLQNEVTHSGDTLTLTTTTPGDRQVASEQLTVRASDFHPVRRAVELRDYGTVEIAELSYEQRPWRPSDEPWFEPVKGMTPLASSVAPHGFLPPARLSPGELDEAELDVMLTLYRLNADNSERIHLARGVDTIVVTGVISSALRKQEIERELHKLAHVQSSLRTVQEVLSHPSAQEEIHSLSVASESEGESPLASYLASRSFSSEQINSISTGLLESSLNLREQSHAIQLLLGRFDAEGLSSMARLSLNELLMGRRQQMARALANQSRMLSALGISVPREAAPVLPRADLLHQAERNYALCLELVTSAEAAPRPASTIATDLARSAQYLSQTLSQSPSPERSSSADGR